MHPVRPPVASGASSREPGHPRGSTPVLPDYPPRPASRQPSLPSIRQLHPYLPPSSLAAHSSIHPEAPPTPYSSAVHYAHPTLMESSSLKRGYDPPSLDSDADEGDHTTSPPKKKRRRQALSCTECKRRKIKCDRTQPCTPCTRRGEQSRCQWHIVEPVEKYVTRAEYDDLRGRFEEVSAKVDRLQQLYASLFQTGMPSGPPGTGSEAMSSFSGSGPLAYHPMINPAHAHHHHHLDTTTLSQGLPHPRAADPKDTHHARHHHSPPPVASTQPASPVLRRPTPSDKVPGSSAPAKQSPLSLASITTPFNHPADTTQSKNCHAQTFALGERLRTVSRPLQEEEAEEDTQDPVAAQPHIEEKNAALPQAAHPRRQPRDHQSTQGHLRRYIWSDLPPPHQQAASWQAARRPCTSHLPIQLINECLRHEIVTGGL